MGVVRRAFSALGLSFPHTRATITKVTRRCKSVERGEEEEEDGACTQVSNASLATVDRVAAALPRICGIPRGEEAHERPRSSFERRLLYPARRRCDSRTGSQSTTQRSSATRTHLRRGFSPTSSNRDAASQTVSIDISRAVQHAGKNNTEREK